MKYRIEHDTMGEIKVPDDKYWGAQTERSKRNFLIGQRKMPFEMISALAILKKAAAHTNYQLENLEREKAEMISKVADEIIEGKLCSHFPLRVFQTGSGTQTNMNVNEVIANRGNQLAGFKLLHPNEDVNRAQSSNDTFPSAMHIAARILLEEKLLPKVRLLSDAMKKLEKQYNHVIKIGRTHLQDATPLTFGQEISGWKSMLEHDYRMIEKSLDELSELALGGTAVGTGLNAPAGFGTAAAQKISEITGKKFYSGENKFYCLTSKGALTFASGAMKTLAADLMKVANDVRWLASGPRSGLGEIRIPENEPGSSIMPGKVNPTQCEAMTMACVQVMGNDSVIRFASSQGNFELNVYMPLIIDNFLESANLLVDAIHSFCQNCVIGIEPNEEKMQENVNNSLMLVTALNPHIGYENAAKIAQKAYRENITLREAALRLNLVEGKDFDEWADPQKMI